MMKVSPQISHKSDVGGSGFLCKVEMSEAASGDDEKIPEKADAVLEEYR